MGLEFRRVLFRSVVNLCYLVLMNLRTALIKRLGLLAAGAFIRALLTCRPERENMLIFASADGGVQGLSVWLYSIRSEQVRKQRRVLCAG